MISVPRLPTISDAHLAAEALQNTLDPGEVLLFGSVARGTQDTESDLDLVLVFDDLGDYSDRQKIAGEARETVQHATGLACDVRVTDRPEWYARTKRCRSTFEAHIASCAVTLLSRLPGDAVDWDKEIGMAPTDQGQAVDSLSNTNHALNSLIAELRPSPDESDALVSGDLEYADDLKRSRLLNICSWSQTVMETSLKSLIHALRGPHPARIHNIGDLIDAACANLPPDTDDLCTGCLGTITPKEASVWHQTGTYPADVDIIGNPESATEEFAAQMAAAAARMATTNISVIERQLGYRPTQADLCLARCGRIADIQRGGSQRALI